MYLSNNAALLLLKLTELPLDYYSLQSELASGKYTPEDVTQAVTHLVAEECVDEMESEYYYRNRFSKPVLRQNLHSTHLYDVIKLALDYGLDATAVYDGENLIQDLIFIDNEYVAADTLALLFESGVNPNMKVDGRSVFSDVDFDVLFYAYNQYDRRRYDALVHCWFVFIGYGGKPENGTSAVDVLYCPIANELDIKKFELSDLRNHRNYTFGLSHVKGRGENWSLHIFDRRTRWEVARL